MQGAGQAPQKPGEARTSTCTGLRGLGRTSSFPPSSPQSPGQPAGQTGIRPPPWTQDAVTHTISLTGGMERLPGQEVSGSQRISQLWTQPLGSRSRATTRPVAGTCGPSVGSPVDISTSRNPAGGAGPGVRQHPCAPQDDGTAAGPEGPHHGEVHLLPRRGVCLHGRPGPTTRSLLTTGRAQSQEDDHGVDYQDVHGGRLPAAPAQEDLVLRL